MIQLQVCSYSRADLSTAKHNPPPLYVDENRYVRTDLKRYVLISDQKRIYIFVADPKPSFDPMGFDNL